MLNSTLLTLYAISFERGGGGGGRTGTQLMKKQLFGNVYTSPLLYL